MSYLEKYLKYKTKYLNLKYQIGGNLNCGEMNVIFDLMDSNKDGNISEGEFLKFYMDADADKDKTISLKELKLYLNTILKDLFELIKYNSSTNKDSISLTNIDSLFDKIDISKNGKINSFEFVSASQLAKITNTHNINRLFNFLSTSPQIGIEKDKFNNIINTLIKASDKDKDNAVSKNEFVRKIESIASDVFKALDLDKDEKITEKELKTIFKTYSGEDLKLSKDEFVKMMETVSDCKNM